MKPNHEMRLFLIAMFINMVISFLLGYKFKDSLITLMSPAIYYQAIVFISLLLPHAIKHFDRKIRLSKLSKNIEKLKSDVNIDKQNNFDENTRAMYEKVVNTDISTTETIKNLHDELESLTK
ncbi:hypothetical protein ACX5DZ_000813 [Enterobacter hormaechei]